MAERAWRLDGRLVQQLLLVWLASVVLAHLLRHGAALPRLGGALAALLVESVLLLAYVVALLSYQPVRAWLRVIPSPHRTVLAAFFFLLATGQLSLHSRRTFPFPSWTMYGRPEAPAMLMYYRYHGVDRDGRAVEIDPAELFRFVNVAEIDSRVRAFARPAAGASNPVVREEARAKVRDWLAAIAAAYDRKHAGAPLRSLEFVRYSWEFRRVPASAVAPEPLLRIELPEGETR